MILGLASEARRAEHGVADRLGGVGLGPIKTFGGFSKFWKYVVLWRSPGAAGTENKAPR